MAVVLESVTQTLVGTNDTTPTFNMPATRPDGNLYALAAACDGGIAALAFGGVLSDLTNSTAAEGTVGAKVMYTIGASEPASYTGSGDSEEYVFHLLRFSGMRTDADMFNNGLGTAGTGASTTAVAPTDTPDFDGGMTIRLWGIDTDAPTGSAPAGHDNFNGSSSSAGGAGSAYGGIARQTATTTATVAVGTATMGGTYDDGWGGVTFIVNVAVSVTPQQKNWIRTGHVQNMFGVRPRLPIGRSW